MTDTTSTAAQQTAPVDPTVSAIEAALASAAKTAASSLEQNAIAYLQGLEAKAKSELGVVESRVKAFIAKAKAYAKPALIAAVIGGAGYVVAHFKLI